MPATTDRSARGAKMALTSMVTGIWSAEGMSGKCVKVRFKFGKLVKVFYSC